MHTFAVEKNKQTIDWNARRWCHIQTKREGGSVVRWASGTLIPQLRVNMSLCRSARSSVLCSAIDRSKYTDRGEAKGKHFFERWRLLAKLLKQHFGWSAKPCLYEKARELDPQGAKLISIQHAQRKIPFGLHHVERTTTRPDEIDSKMSNCSSLSRQRPAERHDFCVHC